MSIHRLRLAFVLACLTTTVFAVGVAMAIPSSTTAPELVPVTEAMAAPPAVVPAAPAPQVAAPVAAETVADTTSYPVTSRHPGVLEATNIEVVRENAPAPVAPVTPVAAAEVADVVAPEPAAASEAAPAPAAAPTVDEAGPSAAERHAEDAANAEPAPVAADVAISAPAPVASSGAVEVDIHAAEVPDPPGPSSSTVIEETVLVQPPYDPWLPVRMCESTNTYGINTGNGYYGAYQFSISTWNWVAQVIGRSDLDGLRPDLAAPADQDAMAQALAFEIRGGGLQHWPVCGRYYGT